MSRIARRLVVASVVLAISSIVVTLSAAGVAGVGTRPGPQKPAFCSRLKPVAQAHNPMCTHGPDPVPAPSEIAAATTAASYPRAPCIKDAGGSYSSGPRIRVIYAYPADTPVHKSRRQLVRHWLSIAGYNLSIAAGGGNYAQHYRFLCSSGSPPTIKISVVKLMPIGPDSAFTYGDMVTSLENQVALKLGKTNFKNPNHVYGVFVDNLGWSYPYGGQASIYNDDRWRATENLNNTVSPAYCCKYSLIKLEPAWGDYDALVFMHEIGHNLGAVQLSAPHSSGAFHCYDEQDTMCYDDGGSYFANGGSLQPSCSTSEPTEVWDCGLNDYFAVFPEWEDYPGGYWNLSESRWLTPPHDE